MSSPHEHAVEVELAAACAAAPLAKDAADVALARLSSHERRILCSVFNSEPQDDPEGGTSVLEPAASRPEYMKYLRSVDKAFARLSEIERKARAFDWLEAQVHAHGLRVRLYRSGIALISLRYFSADGDQRTSQSAASLLEVIESAMQAEAQA